MSNLSPSERFPPAERWKAFWLAVVPLAVLWGVLLGISVHLQNNPEASHPVAAGAAIALMIAGFLGAMLWATLSHGRLLFFVLLLFAYSFIMYGFTLWPSGGMLLALLLAIYKFAQVRREINSGGDDQTSSSE